MKSCVTLVIFCAIIGVNYCIDIPNPFSKKNKTETKPTSTSTGSASTTPGTIQQIKDCFEDYTELGCFSNIAPWHSLLRPFPLPMSPKDIDVKIYLYTSKLPDKRYTVQLWKDISIEGSDFDPQRPYTAFITHGFSSNGNVSWVTDLKDAYLKHRDANVFIVDWGKGASVWNYLQVAANTRVVGAELKRFGKYLVDNWQLDPVHIHFMGHSLGAHISAYAAKGIPGVGQLTAFDPAQPGFEGSPADVRLTKNDATFVDVIHTNIRPVIPLLGFGLIFPAGHVDYYMNGGALQPGCVAPPLHEVNLTSIADLGKISVDVISKWVACSHGKSYLYYTEALLNDYCTFWGRSTGYFGTAVDVATFGKLGLTLEKFDKCTLDKCSPIGLESEEYPARGAFSVSTSPDSPYCQNDPRITKQMKELRQQKSQQQANGETKTNSKGTLGTLKDILKSPF
ncbi:inactive pancreatic lipase-related protein 1-like [Planococcus citri]|uniref:inactive pancreatic lipase-related protein 1-like n=1 Tax=Planococcus citri TaxID=170843 RepID=UPI0031F810B2